MKLKKIPKITLILYTISILMGVFAIFNIYTSYMYISNLIKEGFDPSSQITQVINYYLTSITPYAFYGICLATLGYITKKVVYLVDLEIVSKLDKEYIENASIENDDEIDKLFKDLDA